MVFVINVIKWLLWTVVTMKFYVAEPLFLYLQQTYVFRLNHLGNSFNIFTLKCQLTTTVIHYSKILY